VFNPDEGSDQSTYQLKNQLEEKHVLLEIVTKKMVMTCKQHELDLSTIESKHGGLY
jgi:hypothetical protein